MTASTFSPEMATRARAIALITAFCEATAHEDLDEEYGEVFFDLLDEVAEDPDPDAVQKIIIALVSFVSGALDHLDIDCERCDIIAGLAHELYGGSA